MSGECEKGGSAQRNTRSFDYVSEPGRLACFAQDDRFEQRVRVFRECEFSSAEKI